MEAHRANHTSRSCFGPLRRVAMHQRTTRGGPGMGKTIKDTMTSNPCSIDVDKPVSYAAKMMRDGCGLAPIVEGDRLVGTLTDRDIAMRVVAEGRDPNRPPCVKSPRAKSSPSLRSRGSTTPATDGQASGSAAPGRRGRRAARRRGRAGGHRRARRAFGDRPHGGGNLRPKQVKEVAGTKARHLQLSRPKAYGHIGPFPPKTARSPNTRLSKVSRLTEPSFLSLPLDSPGPEEPLRMSQEGRCHDVSQRM